MTDVPTLDDEARAELLCYLVVGQLVESTRIWLASNGAQADWSERAHLGALSERIAIESALIEDGSSNPADWPAVLE